MPAFRILPYITIYDYKSIEEYLAIMAAKGWRTESIDGLLWRFKRAEPSNKKFFILFTSSSSEIEASSTKIQIEQLFANSGWEKEFQWKDMHIFISDHDAVPLETEQAQLENIHKNMKKTFIPNVTKALIIILIITFINNMRYFGNSSYIDEKAIWAFLLNMYCAFMVGSTLLGYLLWFRFSKKKVSEGGKCVSTKWYRKFLIVLLIGLIVHSIRFLFS